VTWLGVACLVDVVFGLLTAYPIVPMIYVSDEIIGLATMARAMRASPCRWRTQRSIAARQLGCGECSNSNETRKSVPLAPATTLLTNRVHSANPWQMDCRRFKVS
jgi:hypothetical protein